MRDLMTTVTSHSPTQSAGRHGNHDYDDDTWLAQDATRIRSDAACVARPSARHASPSRHADASRRPESAQVLGPESLTDVPAKPLALSAGTGPTDAVQQLQRGFNALADNIGQVVVGKPTPIRLCVTALLAGGHVLVEDDPGTGKTQLAKGLARSVAASFSRIQFTADLLPSDIVGVTVYDRKRATFDFRPGPVFASILLADEINRASPKTQSALLEVMEEHQVTVDGQMHAVPEPFMVVATQNPADQLGTYRLPDAQLDRFMIRTSLRHPGHEASLDLARHVDMQDRSTSISPVLDADRIITLRTLASDIHVADMLLDYIVRIVEELRRCDTVASGPSTRGMLALVRCVRVWAAANGRNYVVPDDVKDLASAVLAHRLTLHTDALLTGHTGESVVLHALDTVPVPTSDT